MSTYPIAYANGDGIGPEIMEAVQKILCAAGAPLDWKEAPMGLHYYEQGISTGIPDHSLEIIQQSRAFLKAPMTTPQGKGVKSLNVTLRKLLGLSINIRPVQAFYPFLPTHHRDLSLTIIRENEEDLYTGIEYQPTWDTAVALKTITMPASRRIAKYAFEYAKATNASRVTCMSKDNIMKLTDGLFHRAFDEVAENYAEITAEHHIIDIGAALLATHPERFQVIVTENLYGDILSDIAAQLVGSVGLAGSVNLGEKHVLFEAIHGSAPDIAGKQIANPSGLLQAAIMLLSYLGLQDTAQQIQNAWLFTLESGEHTADIYSTQHSQVCLSTQEFADAVISHLGAAPKQLRHPTLTIPLLQSSIPTTAVSEQTLHGMDVYLSVELTTPETLAAQLQEAAGNLLPLIAISSRGMAIWPKRPPILPEGHLWRCRFYQKVPTDVGTLQRLLQQISNHGFSWVRVEQLFCYDGKPGFSQIQGL